MNKKEEFLIIAVRNLLKTKGFLKICIMLEEGQITQEEYDKELKKNQGLYVIDIEYVKDKKDIETIAEIIKDLGPIAKELSVNDVGEIFSLDGQQIVEFYQFNNEPEN